jgi:hypothetical protein
MTKILKMFLLLIIALPFTSYAAEPELPRQYIDTSPVSVTGKTIEVKSGGDLQAAINNAVYGDEIVLESGATFTGGFTLPKKSGSGVIILRSSRSGELPFGTRVSPSNASLMAKIKSPGSNVPALTAVDGSAGWRIIGIEFAKANPSAVVTNLVLLGDAETPSLDLLPRNIILERVYAHGDPTSNLRRCVALNGAHMAVIDSYISDCHEKGADSQAVAGWNGSGPFKIVNNYLEAASENILFGGSDPAITNLIPSDIEIRRNHVFKPLSWKGAGWVVKNLFETKAAARVLVDGNIFENSWVDGQTGIGILIKSANQGGKCTQCRSSDITFSNNIIKNVVEAISINGAEGSPLPPKVARVKFKNVIFENVSGRFMLIMNGSSDITLDNVTGGSAHSILFGDAGNGSTNPGLVIKNSALEKGLYGIGAGSEEGTIYLNKWFPGAVFENNTLVKTSSEITSEKLATIYPSGTKIVTSTSQVPSGIGADMNAINSAISQVALNVPSYSTPYSSPYATPYSTPYQTPYSTPVTTPTTTYNYPTPASNNPSGVSSQTISDIQAQLTQLMARLAELERTNRTSGGSGSSYSTPYSTPPAAPSSPSAPSASSAAGAPTNSLPFSRDLTLASTGPDVTALQQMLVAKGFLIMPEGVAFGYFGDLTRQALSKWQYANGIFPSAGYWGPLSRAKAASSN